MQNLMQSLTKALLRDRFERIMFTPPFSSSPAATSLDAVMIVQCRWVLQK